MFFFFFLLFGVKVFWCLCFRDSRFSVLGFVLLAVVKGLGLVAFGGLWFRVLCSRGLGLTVLGFVLWGLSLWALCFGVLGFRVLGFVLLGFRALCFVLCGVRV